jgi:uncharacterized protein YidB (DUF937 family)
MGLFDSVLGAVSGQLQQQGGLANVLSGLLSADGGQGGLGGLVDKFNQAGMGDVVASWIGSGENLPISADQISGILGSDAVANVARQLGLDPAQAAGQLSQMLPGLIDKLTPNGALPQGGLGNAGDLMGLLGGLLRR